MCGWSGAISVANPNGNIVDNCKHMVKYGKISYTSGLAHRIFDFIDYAVRIALKPYVPGVKPVHLEYSIFADVKPHKSMVLIEI